MVVSYTNLVFLLIVEPVLSRIDPVWFIMNMYYNNKTSFDRVGIVIPSAGTYPTPLLFSCFDVEMTGYFCGKI